MNDAIETGDAHGQENYQQINEKLFHKTHACERIVELSHTGLTMSTIQSLNRQIEEINHLVAGASHFLDRPP
jgi:hypothetical protein